MQKPPPYAGFLGTWILDPASCRYEQGEPPREGLYRIEADPSGRLSFTMAWTDIDGKQHQALFSGVPDGRREPFEGGDLADELSVDLVSQNDLRSSAYYRGVERMVAQRQLDATGNAMRVTQIVWLPHGESLANVAIYVKQAQA